VTRVGRSVAPQISARFHVFTQTWLTTISNLSWEFVGWAYKNEVTLHPLNTKCNSLTHSLTHSLSHPHTHWVTRLYPARLGLQTAKRKKETAPIAPFFVEGVEGTSIGTKVIKAWWKMCISVVATPSRDRNMRSGIVKNRWSWAISDLYYLDR
jgi:hypothetical protein